MLVNVYGCGFAGIVSALGLCERDVKVHGIDIDPRKIQFLRNGSFPGNDPVIDSLISKHLNRSLSFFNFGSAPDSSKVSLIALPTPFDGHSLALDSIKSCCNHILQNARNQSLHTILIRSTLPIGGLAQIEMSLRTDIGLESGKDFIIAYYPEFMREGTGLEDFTHPPLSVVGQNHGSLPEDILQLFGEHDHQMLAGKEAEALKLLCNAFHATKVTFANEAMRICNQNDISADTVMRAFCIDNKLNISKKYLKPGFAWGGGCLGKDTKALVAQNAKTPLLNSLETSNEIHIEFFLRKILQDSPTKIAFVGASFKENVNDVRDSSVIRLIQMCHESKSVKKILIFDENRDLPGLFTDKEKIIFSSDVQQLVDVEVVIFRNAPSRPIKNLLTDKQLCIEL